MSGLVGILDGSEIYEATMPVDDILRELPKIRDLDKRQEKVIESIKGKITLAIIGCVVGFLIALASGIAYFAWEMAQGGILGIILALAIGIPMAIWYNKLESRRYNEETLEFPDEYYETAFQVLDLISEDIDSTAAVHLKLMMKPTMDPDFMVKKGKIRGFNTWNVTYYDHCWLTMSGRFLDKTKFSLTARTLAQLRERRNPKGKYKSKSKFKRLIRLNLRPDPTAHLYWKEVLTDAESAIQLPESIQLKKWQPNNKGITLSVHHTPTFKAVENPAQLKGRDRNRNITPDTIMRMFLSGFHIINLSAELSRARSR